MYVNCTYAALITRALAVAIIFAQSSAYSNPQRSSAPIVSSIISDYDDWKHLDDRQYFGSFDNNDKDNEDSETSEASSISSLPLKRSGASRLCGNKLVEMIVKMCKGCVKPAGGKPVTAKRSILNVMKRSSLTDKCCIHRCTLEDMKSFCCD